LSLGLRISIQNIAVERTKRRWGISIAVYSQIEKKSKINVNIIFESMKSMALEKFFLLRIVYEFRLNK